MTLGALLTRCVASPRGARRVGARGGFGKLISMNDMALTQARNVS